MSTSKATLFRLGNISLERIKIGDLSPYIFPQFSICEAEEQMGNIVFTTQEYLSPTEQQNIETIVITNFSPLDIVICYEGILDTSYFILDNDGPKWKNYFEIKDKFITKRMASINV